MKKNTCHLPFRSFEHITKGNFLEWFQNNRTAHLCSLVLATLKTGHNSMVEAEDHVTSKENNQSLIN